ncbi:MAG: bifunctional oligoribonuclease/PAP phosphatase NrnA [Bacilli bacterium]|jgi:phosphoesterase RecJ-like protein|nr:bifunctional oligoribonuclease/PAP phosphatase NrnA [Bacilli bacterium]
MNSEVLLNKIMVYDNICLYAHQFPDPDALGSQFGLKQFISDNFPGKKVYALGKNNDSLNGTIFPLRDEVNEDIIKNSLVIVLDTANISRIDDELFQLGKEIIKIDHHPEVDEYGQFNIVETDKCATSYIVADIIRKSTYLLSKDCAKFLLIGIIGDTGRFLHNNTTSEVFAMASFLMSKGVVLADVYDELYKRTINEAKLVGYILNNFKVINNKLAYYILEVNDYQQFNICFEKAKDYVNTLANIDGIEIWVSIVYSQATGFYHVSIRSKSIPINDVAAAMGGGGHALASGVKATSLARVQIILDSLQSKLE